MKRAVYREIAACRLCRGHDLIPILDLGELALTGVFPGPGQEDPPSAPLTLVRCADCALVQLRHSVDPAAMFGANYGYRSGINSTMRSHLGTLAARIAERAGLAADDAVLDIGCNDGTLLMSYTTPGLLRIGMDPIADTMRDAYPASLRVQAGFFDAQTFRALCGREHARAVTSIAMFYDLEDPGAFVGDVAQILAPDGIWVLEQSYLPSMLAQNAFDTICHEHLEYYAFSQIERLLREHGLRPFDVSVNAVNGGSFQVWACHAAAAYPTNDAAIAALTDREQRLALSSDVPYREFRSRIASIGERLCALVSGEARAGRKTYVYGASTKGNVLLQHFGLDGTLIHGCADRNEAKWGHRTPGTGIPIVSEEAARKDADCFLVLPWAFRNEFLAREADFRARGGRLIFPLPDVEIV